MVSDLHKVMAERREEVDRFRVLRFGQWDFLTQQTTTGRRKHKEESELGGDRLFHSFLNWTDVKIPGLCFGCVRFEVSEGKSDLLGEGGDTQRTSEIQV